MRTFRLWMTVILACIAWEGLLAHVPDGVRRPGKASNKVNYRAVCAASTSAIDQDINNVRARLLGGGDCWWNFDDGRYIVPKVDVSSGQAEVSSIFAGSVWLGGLDGAGNLKLACQDYRPGGDNDFWPGPLSDEGITEASICANWNKHFKVTGNEIRRHLANLAEGKLGKEDIPRGVKGWPATGNQNFVEVWGFDLPTTQQGLAGFFDKDLDGLYDPLKGDYPSIEIRGCQLDRYPDEMVFWIYNDQGGGAEHARTMGRPIQMEVQVQSFGYVTTDELNDMTFQRYKLINRAPDRIDSTFFAMWVDPDLGCYTDDYIGCDTTKNLMYVYNQDATDGQPGCNCDQGVTTYCDKVPILGVDYFRGPLDTFGNEIGMSSFVYYNNPSVGNPLPGTTDPDLPAEFYNYLTGTWKDGSPLQFGGSGYQSGGNPVKYALSDAPNDPTGWSMCTAGLPFSDRRTLQASGPFSLKTGAVNELIIGVPWVPDITYPCPDLENLFRADKLAQGLFDNCFELLDGPDAPKVDWVEMDQQLIAVLTNVAPSNNIREQYRQQDFLAPDSLKFDFDPFNATPEEIESTYYKFEGYKIYQLLSPNVSNAEFESNPDNSRLVYQVDLKNGITSVYNWIETLDPNTGKKIYYPEIRVQGEDKGIRHSFSITDDKFALGNDKRLINHKKYYYAVIAYAYNDWGTFNPLQSPAPGQQNPYLPGRRGSDGNQVSIVTVIPRPIVDQVLNSAYGEGVVITRLEGAGAGGNFLDLDEDTRERLFAGGLTDTILTYKEGRGPVNVSIFNPFEVKDGEYELRLVDSNNSDKVIDTDARWELRKLPDGEVIVSEKTIADVNEQLLLDYGFSITMAQTGEPGDRADDRNGVIGGEIEFADPDKQWLTGYPDRDPELFGPFFHFIKTRKLEVDEALDPKQSFSTIGNGWFAPYALCDWRTDPATRFATPAWTERGGATEGQLSGSAMGQPANRQAFLAKLPNVDIVLTKDKSKWSRCIVVESASVYYTFAGYPKDATLKTESPANKARVMFDVRYQPSVGKDGKPDGAVNPSGTGIPSAQVGQPVYGMGWFPGYAIDVETGQRLNIFFGENSCYSSDLDPRYTGRDMIWNPTEQTFRQNTGGLPNDYYNAVLGGQHWVYVMYTPYDSCEIIRRRFTPEFNGNPPVAKISQVRNIAWAGMLQVAPGYQMTSIEDGLIPNDVRVKLRVDNRYQTWFQDDNGGQPTGHPKYLIKIGDRQPTALSGIQIDNALDSVKVVPNPYYGFSQYETSQFTNTIKITNLPAVCTVTIYSLDGKFIRQYQRNEVYAPYQQIVPDLEWDLKNSKGIPVASGVYLIQIQAPGMGERTVKWFGIGRQFDPSGL